MTNGDGTNLEILLLLLLPLGAGPHDCGVVGVAGVESAELFFVSARLSHVTDNGLRCVCAERGNKFIVVIGVKLNQATLLLGLRVFAHVLAFSKIFDEHRQVTVESAILRGIRRDIYSPA